MEPVQNFTPRAQQALAHAREEAERYHHHFVGTEHVLLGLIRLGQGVAVTVLQKLGMNLETVRAEFERNVGAGPAEKTAHMIPYTPRVKKVLALAAKEAQALNHTYVGTEHILLGLLREADGVAARILKTHGVDIEATRLEILGELDPNFTRTHMDTKASEPTMNLNSPQSEFNSIDTTKRYDVYCSERSQQVVVYRNALFKGRKKLLGTGQHEFGAEFLELEQSNGQTIFLSMHSVIKFCEHGGENTGEIIAPK